MPEPKKKRARTPLSRERVLSKALELADARGLEALSMRELGQALGVEAMSLYKHVANKDDLLDGLVELVIAEVELPTGKGDWKRAMRARAQSARQVMLRHRWAAALIESRLHPGPARLGLHEATIRVLRSAGFGIGLAYHAYLTLDSYIYGFVLQEVWWPFTPGERPAVIDALAPAISPEVYPHMTEMMGFVMSRARQRATSRSYDRDFAFGLDLLLDGLERALHAET